jgi:hypothetical protein
VFRRTAVRNLFSYFGFVGDGDSHAVAAQNKDALVATAIGTLT